MGSVCGAGKRRVTPWCRFGESGKPFPSLFSLSNLPFPSGPSRQSSLLKAICCGFGDAVTAAAPRPQESGCASPPPVFAETEVPRAVGTAGGVNSDPPPLVCRHPRRLPPASAQSVAPSLSFQVQRRCCVTVTEPGSRQAPSPRRQQHLPRRRTRLARGTYLAKCAPALGAELHRDFLLAVHPEKKKARKQLASRRIRGAAEEA